MPSEAAHNRNMLSMICKGIDHPLMLVMFLLLLWAGNVVSSSFPNVDSPCSGITAQTICLLIQACGIDKAP